MGKPRKIRKYPKYPKVKGIPGNTWLLTKSSDMGRKGCGVENKNSSRTSEPDHCKKGHMCSALLCIALETLKSRIS